MSWSCTSVKCEGRGEGWCLSVQKTPHTRVYVSILLYASHNCQSSKVYWWGYLMVYISLLLKYINMIAIIQHGTFHHTWRISHIETLKLSGRKIVLQWLSETRKYISTSFNQVCRHDFELFCQVFYSVVLVVKYLALIIQFLGIFFPIKYVI